MTFLEAELACFPENGDDFDSRLMWTTKRAHYEFVGRLLRRSIGMDLKNKVFDNETHLLNISSRSVQFLGWLGRSR